LWRSLYALKRWLAFTRYLDGGRLEIDNFVAERALRGVAMSLYTSLSSIPEH